MERTSAAEQTAEERRERRAHAHACNRIADAAPEYAARGASALLLLLRSPLPRLSSNVLSCVAQSIRCFSASRRAFVCERDCKRRAAVPCARLVGAPRESVHATQ
eukprot:4773266-Pleurochrysis_carterae.AAC.1